ncbi:L-rhamnulokinase [Gracilibacillus ureilyticus]|uniref:Rhamnulokinase n=1 Tax=Gracilibacillus ureilyticus TaxID=531814 RepID=A0A1H9LHA4_9BACI|nr:rhamnulokinase [Gracilibacillus ureilyticus]SER10629.1 L-rhamnulokinase [Gracilibacillus ureilyticus]
MQKCHLAVDIGASGGRVIAGYLASGELILKEVHRFENKMTTKNGHLSWDIDQLFEQIKTGIKKSVEKNCQPVSLGIDTWAVDFVLLNKEKERITEAVAYRDHRTDGVMEEVFNIVPKKELYKETGIQFQPFNTIYQLYALKKESPEILKDAAHFLMIPDYLHYLLTDKITNEYTNATTTQLLNAKGKTWNTSFIEKLGISQRIFSEPKKPLQAIGKIKDELKVELGVDFEVVLPGTHDTASAVVSVPSNDTIFISSGTWSLIGVEHQEPISTERAFLYNFTNEGGVNHNFRFLKNIMGLWMIQEVKRAFNHQYDYPDFTNLAYENADFPSIVNVNEERFLSPDNMLTVIQDFCRETKQIIPEMPGEFAACIFNSLAVSYNEAVGQIEELTGKEFESIHIIGGGSKNNYLNERLADISGKTIYTGPTEATAIGNLIAQMVATNEIESIEKSKEIINQSFHIQKFSSGGE